MRHDQHGEIAEHERPISELFRLAAEEYADAETAADLLDEMKTTTLEQMKSRVIAEKGDMADNRAERIVKSGQDWTDYIMKLVESKSAARRLKLKLEYWRIREREIERDAWRQRTEMKMGRSTT